ncbi:hypothetical protein [Arenicella xantha]|uniref:TolB-like protein n=1 Tax=Arenicella xantha TaxID=644221 RepID=A0A395JP49_9GAMM|nr:hypothetical protein [Arenicella xantha]RBP51567.1 TolB-like protein [Arenicella xantha]
MELINYTVQWLTDNESALSAMAAILVIAGITYGALRYILTPFLQRNSEESKKPTESDDAPKVTALHNNNFSLAVLLFDALSSNEEDEFVAAGITSEIIAHVTMVPHIRVSSRLSSYQVSKGKADIQRIAEQLNTRFVLTGSLRHKDDRIRVIAQLSDINANAEIWAQTYDRKIQDLFEVQQDIAKCIVGAVLGEVKLAETMFAGSLPEQSLDAWGLVQKAFHFWLTNFTPDGILKACDYLRQAIKIDPNYASARASLAMLLAQQMTTRICEDYEACADEARALIETAYQQSPNDIDVLENAGVVWQNIGESRRAELALRRVVQMAPLNLISRGYLALLLAFTGDEADVEEAEQLILENFATAPKHPSAPYWNFFLAVVELRHKNYEQVISLTKKSLIQQPGWVHNYFLMANAHCELGDESSAIIAIENAATINPHLTSQLFAENVYRIVGGQEHASWFVDGLKEYKLIK